MEIRLKEFFYLPNVLSFIRIILVIPIGYILITIENTNNATLIFLVLLAILSDYFDGYFSRKLNAVTELGKILDPIADKLAMAVILILLSVYHSFPFTLVALLIYRDIVIIIFGFLLIRKTGETNQANIWGKLNTAVIALTVFIYLLQISSVLLTVLIVCSYLTILISGYSYYKIADYYLLKSKVVKFAIRFIVIVFTILFIIFMNKVNVKIWTVESQNYILLEINEEKEYEILKKYAPIFYFANNEQYFPIEVNSFLDNAKLMRRSFFIPFDTELYTLDNKNILREYSSENYYLKLDRKLFDNIEKKYSSIKNDYQNVIYGSARKLITKNKSYYMIQYWLFFYASHLGSTSIAWHECDWEMVMYLADVKTNELFAGYSQHYYGEVRKESKMEFEDSQPVAYISFGGHSIQFNEGSHPSYLDHNKLLQIGSDFCEKGIRWNSNDYKLIPLKESEPWFEFKGYWGIPITTKLQGPKFRNPKIKDLTMWTHPIEWMNYFAKPESSIP